MFLFLPKFDLSFSRLPKFNWSCCTLTKCSYLTQMCLILPKTLLKFFSWPIFDEGCWNYHMIPVHSRTVFILPSRAKRMAVWLLFHHWFGYYFALVWKIDTISLTCECGCILCPNFENFCPNKGQFFSVGDATASPCCTLMSAQIRKAGRGIVLLLGWPLSGFRNTWKEQCTSTSEEVTVYDWSALQSTMGRRHSWNCAGSDESVAEWRESSVVVIMLIVRLCR